MADSSIRRTAPEFDRREILNKAHFTVVWRRSSRAAIYRNKTYCEMLSEALKIEWEEAHRRRTMTIAIRERAAADAAAGIVRPMPTKQKVFTRGSGYVAGSFGQ